MQHQPTDEQLSAVGIDRINDHTSFEGTVNYVAVYEFAGKATALRMCDKMRGYMDVRASTVGAFRAKVVLHDWEGKGPLRLGMSGEAYLLLPGSTDGGWRTHPMSSLLETAGTQTEG